MKIKKGRDTIIFIKTTKETKDLFLEAIKLECTDQVTLLEYLIKKESKRIIKKYENNQINS